MPVAPQAPSTSAAMTGQEGIRPMDERRGEHWPAWAWVLFALQVATLVVALVPWVAMASSMGAMGGMMGPMMDPGRMMPAR